ncbi:MAG TPA: flavodoxin domain-containing protein [Dehalococcoidia bacterium]|nr:flavodoxin domain-containing protein [Dehalococcoidia bacterium]
MRALIAVASRHGSTWEIGSALASEFQGTGVSSDLLEAKDVQSLEEYDLVVIGSAVYMGHWMVDALDLVDRFHDDLVMMPVWLFSSGPIGADDPKPHGDPHDIPGLVAQLNAEGHRVFAGKLDKKVLGVGERLATGIVRAPEGDFRDWDAIRVWADEIAAAMTVAVR